MKLGIIGLKGSGKTTVFRVLTHGKIAHPPLEVAPQLEVIPPNTASIKVPDPRLDFLASVFKPKKTTYAIFEFIDPPGFAKATLSLLQTVDALIHVIPSFGEFKEPIKYFDEVMGEIEQIESLSQKPMVLILNRGEEVNNEIIERAEKQSLPLVDFNAKLELEIEEFEPNERDEYEKEFGIGEPPLQRFIRIGYPGLKIITFFTVVGDEVKAWQLNPETPVVRAAGKVHSDMERGFIRAQIIGYEDFKSVGSFGLAKEKGLIRVVNRDYIVQDGDIIEFRFHVR